MDNLFTRCLEKLPSRDGNQETKMMSDLWERGAFQELRSPLGNATSIISVGLRGNHQVLASEVQQREQ